MGFVHVGPARAYYKLDSVGNILSMTSTPLHHKVEYLDYMHGQNSVKSGAVGRTMDPSVLQSLVLSRCEPEFLFILFQKETKLYLCY